MKAASYSFAVTSRLMVYDDAAARDREEINGMKLAEALQERADLKEKIAQLHSRIEDNCKVQEGEKTAEDPVALMEALDSSLLREEALVAAINLTNSQTMIDGQSVTALIAHKDRLAKQLSAYRSIAREASLTAGRARGSEIKILSAVDVRAIQQKADTLAKELRLADNKLQQHNWLTELAE